MKKSLFITATLLTAAVTATYAYAAPNTRQFHMFEQMDTNNDNQLAKDEVTGRLADNFDKFDSNSDGFLTKNELPNRGKHQQRPAFSTMDTNNDGLIAKSEASGRLADNFDKLDSNNDGFLAKDELPNKRRQHQGMRFAKMDTDNDGKISTEEMMQHFNQIDSNNDGFITEDERPRKGQYNNRHNRGAACANLETNNDGQFSRNQSQGRLAENFDRLDSNDDGLLSKEELTKRGNRNNIN
jgi:Ca2+-binding EF-hand superfamily protein